MPLLERNLVYDGWDGLAGGMDQGRRANQIGRNQAALLENFTCRGGIGAEVRPAIRVHPLEFDFPDFSYDDKGNYIGWGTNTSPPTSPLVPLPPEGIGIAIPGGGDMPDVPGTLDPVPIGDVVTVPIIPGQGVDNFHKGEFQDASYFAPRGHGPCIMAMIGGRLYKITPNMSEGLRVAEQKLSRRNRNNQPKAYMQQADRFHITQDGESRPIIFDGVEARRATDDEVPVGTYMAYGMGRLVVTVRGHELTFSDLYGSGDSTDPGDAVVKFTEATFLNEGFNAAITFSLGEITGLHFAPQQDSAVGDGELLAYSSNGVTSFFLSQPREFWKDSAFQRITLLNSGGRSHDMITSFNGDLWYRAEDGFRSYRQARAEIQGWAHLPMSTEVRSFVESDTQALLQFGSAIHFENRLIATCSPRTNQGRVYHKGLLVLDFDVLSSFGQATRPAWDGHWSVGMKIVKLVTGKFYGVQRAFIFGIDDNDNLQIYELERHPGGKDFDGPIPWKMEMRSMDFTSPFNEKEVHGADLWIDSVTDTVTVTAKYKSDRLPFWQEWQTLPPIQAQGVCQAITCGGCPTITGGYYPRRSLMTPPIAADEYTRRDTRRFYEFQTQLTGSGHCILTRFRLSAKDLTEDAKAFDQR